MAGLRSLILAAALMGATAFDQGSGFHQDVMMAKELAPGPNDCQNCDVNNFASPEDFIRFRTGDLSVPTTSACTKSVETIGTPKDECCPALDAESTLTIFEDPHDYCYQKLCESYSAENFDPCLAFQQDTTLPAIEADSGKTAEEKAKENRNCYDLLFHGSGRCAVRIGSTAQLEAVARANLQSATGAIVSTNNYCGSVMMTDDGSECGYQAGCSTFRAGVESACGYWCGRTLSKSDCNAEQTAEANGDGGAPDANSFNWKEAKIGIDRLNDNKRNEVRLGGCFWDDSFPGACSVDTEVIDAFGTFQKTVAITGCGADEEGSTCTEEFNSTDATEPISTSLPGNARCAPCSMGFCQAADGAKNLERAGAKCRSAFFEPSTLFPTVPTEDPPAAEGVEDVKFIRDVVGLADEVGFPNGFPQACAASGNVKSAGGVEFMQYKTSITDHEDRQERCTNLQRTGTGCMWVNQGPAQGCISNVCGYRNTANDCVVQNTQGSCVWFDKKPNGRLNQRSGGGNGDGSRLWTENPLWAQAFTTPHKGCYNSPCSSPDKNKPWKCEFNGNNPALAGCFETCTTGFELDHYREKKFLNGQVRPFYNALQVGKKGSTSAMETAVVEDWLETYPSCNPKSESWSCPCLSWDELGSLPSSSVSPGRNFYRNGQLDASYETEYKTHYGPTSAACKSAQSDPQYTPAFCKTYGPCENIVENDGKSTFAEGTTENRFYFRENPKLVAGSNVTGVKNPVKGVPKTRGQILNNPSKKASKRAREVVEVRCGDEGIKNKKCNKEILQLDTLYQCEWNFLGGGNGGDTVGCQNVEFKSASSGNHIGCDQQRLECQLNPASKFCPLSLRNAPSRGQVSANLLCEQCRPCVEGVPNPQISTQICKGVGDVPGVPTDPTELAAYCVGRGLTVEVL